MSARQGLFKNPKSKRENPLSKLYDDEQFKTVLQHKDNLPEFPFLVDIELTNHCNLNCIFCGQQAMTRHKGFISEEVLKRVIDECSEYSVPVRLVRWGEPFLHPGIVHFCEYAKSRGLTLHVTSNGLAMKESAMKSLVELELDLLTFSFQGATKEQYELMRDNQQYDRLKANVLRMVELRGDRERPFILISSTMTNESKKEIDSFVDYWRRIADAVGIGKTNLSKLPAQGKLQLVKKQETIEKRYRPCTEVYQKLSVDWDGKITCCCGDYDNFLTVGDVHRSTLFDVWNGSRELVIFRELLSKNRHKCLTLCSTCYRANEWMVVEGGEKG